MTRLLALLFICLLLSGCSASSTSAPTARVPVSQNQAPSSTPPPEHTREPVVATPSIAQASPLPTRLSAAMPTSTSTPTPAPTETPALAPILSSYPIGMPGKPPGDGFFIRHGYAAENTWYNPGYWHTGEDWYAIDGDTAGARVYAIADGQVVYAGANYPGRVVVIRHAADLYSMYGHLDPSLNVRSGQQLARGDLIGIVLRRGDGRAPSHLHFEVRAFLTTSAVNGDRPHYPFRCGRNCPPGPGYWPIEAPDHPSALGWRNPTHVIAHRMVDTGGALGEAVVATKPISPSVTLWSAPPDDSARAALGELELRPGERFPLLEIQADAEDSRETSALAYRLWYRIRLSDGGDAWVQAAIPSAFEMGGDGRPSSVYFNFFPSTDAKP